MSIVLENIGVEISAPPDSHLEQMLKRFDGRFPLTRDFSSYARSTLPGVRPQDGADAALMAWMEREEALFQATELGKALLLDMPSTDRILELHRQAQARLSRRWAAAGASGLGCRGREVEQPHLRA